MARPPIMENLVKALGSAMTITLAALLGLSTSGCTSETCLSSIGPVDSGGKICMRPYGYTQTPDNLPMPPYDERFFGSYCAAQHATLPTEGYCELGEVVATCHVGQLVIDDQGRAAIYNVELLYFDVLLETAEADCKTRDGFFEEGYDDPNDW